MIRNDDGLVVHMDEVQPFQPSSDSGLSGLELRFISGSMSGCDGLCLFRTIFEPGGGNPRHIHPNADEFLYVIKGRAALGVENTEHVGSPGTVHMIPAGKTHWLRNLEKEQVVEVIGGYIGVPSRDAAGYIRVGDVSEQYRKLR